ncbi:anaerobic dimethyl sulfoxide reductase subunit A [Modicisalibacter ilicicola DSM 19980]|uniref:Anaerobic dimethyl sulfoxide reductase subunit A n=1 Tax=Modicisalibacter ilicicola DSM 19980 TaxID=1121942 RepID=A0A1M4SIV9_9GAMM|nr:hypothetical protein [Halomonas ilicicola]SHE32119.1 anaerobic dimethyl sulfoxide reductase subunit A [Halomonas ilicicola DSM 19980]
MPIKFLWNYAGNCLVNLHSEIKRAHEILADDNLCEMIVVIDNHMTSFARYAALRIAVVSRFFVDSNQFL